MCGDLENGTHNHDRLVGLVVESSALGAEGPEFEPGLWQDFSGSSHTSDLKIGNPVVTLPGAWHCRVSAGTGRPGIGILWLGEVGSLICNLYLSVAACKKLSEQIHPWDTLACCRDIKQATNKFRNHVCMLTDERLFEWVKRLASTADIPAVGYFNNGLQINDGLGSHCWTRSV